MRDRVDVKEKASKLTGMYEDEMMDMWVKEETGKGREKIGGGSETGNEAKGDRMHAVGSTTKLFANQ